MEEVDELADPAASSRGVWNTLPGENDDDEIGLLRARPRLLPVVLTAVVAAAGVAASTAHHCCPVHSQ